MYYRLSILQFDNSRNLQLPKLFHIIFWSLPRFSLDFFSFILSDTFGYQLNPKKFRFYSEFSTEKSSLSVVILHLEARNGHYSIILVESTTSYWFWPWRNGQGDVGSRGSNLILFPMDLRWGILRKAVDSNHCPCMIRIRSDQLKISWQKGQSFIT